MWITKRSLVYIVGALVWALYIIHTLGGTYTRPGLVLLKVFAAVELTMNISEAFVGDVGTEIAKTAVFW